jgi:hypothetical protein
MSWKRYISNHIRNSYLPNLNVTSNRIKRSRKFNYSPDDIESSCSKCGGSGMIEEITFDFICCKRISVTNQEECMKCDKGEFGVLKNYVTCNVCSIDSFPP